jgi:hypothetical protein
MEEIAAALTQAVRLIDFSLQKCICMNQVSDVDINKEGGVAWMHVLLCGMTYDCG